MEGVRYALDGSKQDCPSASPLPIAVLAWPQLNDFLQRAKVVNEDEILISRMVMFRGRAGNIFVELARGMESLARLGPSFPVRPAGFSRGTDWRVAL